MKRLLFTWIALILSLSSYAQLIANKTDNKVTMGLDFFNDFQLSTNENWDARMFNQGFSCALTYNFPLGESTKHTVSIGVGYSGHNYFSYSRILNPYANDTLQFQQYRGETGFKRYIAVWKQSAKLSHDHHFKWWFEYAPIRGEYLHA